MTFGKSMRGPYLAEKRNNARQIAGNGPNSREVGSGKGEAA